MKRKHVFGVIVVLAAVLGCTSLALAQSSGNFTYGNTGTTHCQLNKNNGQITGGTTCSAGTCAADADCSAIGGTCVNIDATTHLGICATSCSSDADCSTGQSCTTGVCTGGCSGTLGAAIKTSSGLGNVFVVRPSAVVGLLTDVSLQKNSTIDVGTSSAYAGVDFSVTANGIGGQPTPCVTPNFSVTYAARYIQISSNLFTVLGNLCTVVANPNQVGGVTTAAGCFFNFSESTVSAHSFDWIVGSPAAAGASSCAALSSGTYGITANWQASLGNTGLSESLTCVGPVNLTVQQNKIFHFNSIN
ncbi:MAG: hypothetical protein DMG22_19750 [Acidobacteria bacterium]|nr:MAG: hypothetical protein DMG22_19750 [Acidobacteriota bacterium]